MEAVGERENGTIPLEDLDTRLNWVVSYPKSGNTWIRLVCRTYCGNRPEYAGVGQLGDVAVRVWHDVSPIPLSELTLASEMQLRPAALLNLAILHEGTETLFKSHHGHYTVQQMTLWKKRWTKKVVNPVRDPRDVCCSAADHFSKSYEETAEMMADEGKTIGGGEDRDLHHVISSWSNHIRSWLDCDKDVLTVRYEDMKAAPMQCFGEIVEHVFEEEPDKELLEKSVETCRFEKLQKKEEEEGFEEQVENQERFFRKGEAGGWKDELPGEVADQIVEDHAEMMEKLDYL